MEQKKKEIKKTRNVKKETNKKSDKNKEIEFNLKKQSTIFFIIITIFVLLMLIGTIAGKNMQETYRVSTYKINFLGDTGNSIYYNEHNKAIENDTCETDEYGYLDPECAHTIACMCQAWSFDKANVLEDYSFSYQHTALNSADLFTKQFSSNETYYCVSNTFNNGECDIPKPTTSCYICDGGNAPVKTINSKRAETMTGGINCTIVNNSYCKEPLDNSRQTTAGLIVVWVIGLSALLYSFIYLKKLIN